MKSTDYHPQMLLLGKSIEKERKRRRLTQSQLADLTQTSINFISQIERGKKTAQIGKVLDVLKVLGLQLLIDKGPSGVVDRNE